MRHILSFLELFPLAVVLGWLAGCSTSARHVASPDAVLITYHIRAGSEKAVEDLVKRAWQVYRREHLVLDEPHICVLVKEDVNNVMLVETFTWVGPFAVEYPSDSVKQIWKEIEALCEDRGGNKGLQMQHAEIVSDGQMERYRTSH